MDYREPADKTREQRLRRWAKRLGYTLQRSRAKRLHCNDYGGYRLVNTNNYIEYGENWDADLDTIEGHLKHVEQEMI